MWSVVELVCGAGARLWIKRCLRGGRRATLRLNFGSSMRRVQACGWIAVLHKLIRYCNVVPAKSRYRRGQTSGVRKRSKRKENALAFPNCARLKLRSKLLPEIAI